MGRAIMMVTAFLLVRRMPKEDYAWYSLANNFQGSLAYITLAGVGTGLYALGGGKIGDRRGMGEVVSAARRLRMRIAIASFPILLPVTAYSLAKTGCPAWTIASLLACLALLLAQQIAVQLAEFPFGLAGKYNVPQISSLLSNVVRLLAIGLLVVMHCLTAASGIAAAVIAGYLILFFYLIPRSHTYIEPRVAPPPELEASFMRHMWIGLPIGIFYAAQSQFGMVVLSLAGSVSSVAELGALSRIGLVMALPEVFINKILTPRLASESDLGRLKRMFLGGVLLGVIGGGGLALLVYLFRTQILRLLGSNYTGMEEELTAYSALLGFSFFVTASSAIVQARGWIRYNWARPVIMLACQLAAVPFCKVDQVTGIVVLTGAGAVGQLILSGILIVKGFQGKASV